MLDQPDRPLSHPQPFAPWPSTARGLAVPALAVTALLVAAPANAQQSGQSVLAPMVQALIAAAPPDTIAVDAVEPLGTNGITLVGLTLRPSPMLTPITAERLMLHEVDLAAVLQQTPPAALDAEIVGLVIGPDHFDDPQLLDALQVDALRADLVLRYTSDQAAGAFRLEQFVLDWQELGRIEASFDVFGFPLDQPPTTALDWLAVATVMQVVGASLSYEDASLLPKLIDYHAETSLEPFDTAGAVDGLENLRQTAASPESNQAIDALARFLSDLTGGAVGPLTITLAPPQPVPIAALANTTGPDQAVAMFGLSINYQR